MNSRVVNVKWHHLVLENLVSNSSSGLLQWQVWEGHQSARTAAVLVSLVPEGGTGKLWLSGQRLRPLKVLCVENCFPSCTGFYGITISTRPGKEYFCSNICSFDYPISHNFSVAEDNIFKNQFHNLKDASNPILFSYTSLDDEGMLCFPEVVLP